MFTRITILFYPLPNNGQINISPWHQKKSQKITNIITCHNMKKKIYIYLQIFITLSLGWTQAQGTDTGVKWVKEDLFLGNWEMEMCEQGDWQMGGNPETQRIRSLMQNLGCPESMTTTMIWPRVGVLWGWCTAKLVSLAVVPDQRGSRRQKHKHNSDRGRFISASPPQASFPLDSRADDFEIKVHRWKTFKLKQAY